MSEPLKYEGGPVLVEHHDALDLEFLAAAAIIDMNGEDQAQTLHHTPEEVYARVERIRRDVRREGNACAVGALILTDESIPLPLAYAVTFGADKRPKLASRVQLTYVGVNPLARGRALSGLVAWSVLQHFNEAAGLSDSVRAAATLLQGGFEAQAYELPDRGGSPLGASEDNVRHRTYVGGQVGGLRRAIKRAFPNMPTVADQSYYLLDI